MYGQHGQQQDENQITYAPFLLDPNAMHHHDGTQGLEIKYMDMLQENDGFDMMLPSQATDFSYYEAISYHPADDAYQHDSNTITPYDPLYREDQSTSELSSFEQSLYSFCSSNNSADALHNYHQHHPPVSRTSFSSSTSSSIVAAGGDQAIAAAAAAAAAGMMVPPPMPHSSSAPVLARHGIPSPLVSSSSSSSLSSSASYANHGESRQQIYVRKACVSCKQSHVACDVQRPCARCVRLNKADTCVDAERKKRGRPCGSGKKKRQQQATAAAAAHAHAHAAAVAAAARYPRI